ncbi:ExbD/TolR family protein [Thiocapsa marina]|uniref:Biopolymer transport protein ExbD/TolR n=1 Tax=Thiocapsa marina 5811 TaxID=768671 RepID=F9U787_9GAMM|nr:biopolymer transporter ExbD [Thiocapsa marina]EGV20113.1 Biopolymer transport protein ExbD/TolR [Thiocapsa marina 5811]
MQLKRSKPAADSEANLIPLINVVFLLLIFFMLAGRLAPTESVALDPPRSNSPQSARAMPLVLLIDRTGQISLDGEPLDETTLAARVADRLADGPPRLQIKADATLEARRLVDLLASLRMAGAEEIDLLTLARDE